MSMVFSAIFSDYIRLIFNPVLKDLTLGFSWNMFTCSWSRMVSLQEGELNESKYVSNSWSELIERLAMGEFSRFRRVVLGGVFLVSGEARFSEASWDRFRRHEDNEVSAETLGVFYKKKNYTIGCSFTSTLTAKLIEVLTNSGFGFALTKSTPFALSSFDSASVSEIGRAIKRRKIEMISIIAKNPKVPLRPDPKWFKILSKNLKILTKNLLKTKIDWKTSVLSWYYHLNKAAKIARIPNEMALTIELLKLARALLRSSTEDMTSLISF